jgi:ArsR family metal-binding transcriptional regulator
MFKPCKTDASFEIVPQGKIDRRKLIDIIVKEFNGRVLTDADFLTLIDVGQAKISVSRSNKIMIRGIKEEEKAREIANKIMRHFIQ